MLKEEQHVWNLTEMAFIIPRPCANPSKEEARRGYYPFSLFARETTEIISPAQD